MEDNELYGVKGGCGRSAEELIASAKAIAIAFIAGLLVIAAAAIVG